MDSSKLPWLNSDELSRGQSGLKEIMDLLKQIDTIEVVALEVQMRVTSSIHCCGQKGACSSHITNKKKGKYILCYSH